MEVGSVILLGVEDKALMQHIKSLGLSSIKEYTSWCKANGIGQGLNKTEALRKKELKILKEQQLQSAMKNNKERLKPLANRLEDISQSEKIMSHFSYGSGFSASFQQTLQRLDKEVQKDYLSFLSKVGKKSKLLGDNFYIEALYQVYLKRANFIRKVEDWVPKTKNQHRQFSAFLRHCFTKYQIPEFMDSAWLGRDLNVDPKPVEWFLWVAEGKNLRKAPDLPIVLTKQMAHLVLDAPNSYNFYQALRYGQILSMNGDHRLAEAVNQTFLSRRFGNEEFWTSVIQFFIQNPFLDRHQVGPIVDYLQNQKYTAQAPQPGLTMKGRNPQALLDQVEVWHKSIQKAKGGGLVRWDSCGVAEFSKEIKTANSTSVWTVEEMVTSKELQDDSRKLHHCVASYVQSCVNKRCAIFSVRLDGERVATIEVVPLQNMIVQAREKYNAVLSPLTRQIVTEWAGQNRLTIKC